MEYIDFQYEEIPINFSSGFTKKRDCFPEIQVLLDRDIKAFEEQAAKSLKNHPGILSQMVLNIYEKEGE